MAKVLGIHETELRPGISGEDFERFFQEKVASMPLPSGWKQYLLKGNRGNRAEKYLVIMEADSVEVRDRIRPTPEHFSSEGQEWINAHKDVYEEWARLASSPADSQLFTDYEVISE